MAQDMTKLKPAVKRKLNITWTDAETEARVDEIMAIADADLRPKIALPDSFDLNTPGQEQKLFLALCLYEWNHAANEFDANYANDILQARQRHITSELRGVSDGDQAQHV